ncbi:hypothetical protein D9M72_294140 [compost metagenome]
MASSGVISWPVTFETKGMLGGRRGTEAMSASSGASSGSVIAECEAIDTCSRRGRWPAARSRASAASTASRGPEITHSCSALAAARSQPGARKGASAACDSGTAVIAPGGIDCSRRPRRAATRSASSRRNTPARQAATYSPRLWPIITAGRTPRRIHHCAIAYATTKSAGCASAMSNSRASASASPPGAGNSTVRRSKPSSGSSSAQQRSMSSRKAASSS